MIPSGDLYRVVVTAYLLQLYQNCSRLLGHVDYSSPLGHLLGDPFGDPLGDPLGNPLKYPLRYPLQA